MTKKKSKNIKVDILSQYYVVRGMAIQIWCDLSHKGGAIVQLQSCYATALLPETVVKIAQQSMLIAIDIIGSGL